MIALVIAACLVGRPCGEYRLILDMTPQACAIDAQVIVAGWAQEHVGAEITGWHCEPARRDERPVVQLRHLD